MIELEHNHQDHGTRVDCPACIAIGYEQGPTVVGSLPSGLLASAQLYHETWEEDGMEVQVMGLVSYTEEGTEEKKPLFQFTGEVVKALAQPKEEVELPKEVSRESFSFRPRSF